MPGQAKPGRCRDTTSAHLQAVCCQPGQSIREWIKNLTKTVGIDLQDEYERIRGRYLNALKPLKSAISWSIWLAEYDAAATEAEAHNVREL